MKLSIKIDSSNDALNEPEEVTRLLRGAADKIEQGYVVGPLVDYNGNKVGMYHVDKEA